MKALQSEPDLVIEGADDVSTGFARVVTENGGALCAEDTALDALSMAVNVREQPRERGRGGTGANTAVGEGPTGLESLRRAQRGARGESLPSARVRAPRARATTPSTSRSPPGARRSAPTTSKRSRPRSSDSTAQRPRVQAGPGGRARPPSRAIPMPPPDDNDATMRHTPIVSAPKDEDLNLFTDDAPRKRR